MQKFLDIVKEPSSSSLEIQEDRLKFFVSKVKIWDYAGLSQGDYQKLSTEARSSILKKYYLDLTYHYPVATNFLYFFLFGLAILFFL